MECLSIANTLNFYHYAGVVLSILIWCMRPHRQMAILTLAIKDANRILAKARKHGQVTDPNFLRSVDYDLAVINLRRSDLVVRLARVPRGSIFQQIWATCKGVPISIYKTQRLVTALKGRIVEKREDNIQQQLLRALEAGNVGSPQEVLTRPAPVYLGVRMRRHLNAFRGRDCASQIV